MPITCAASPRTRPRPRARWATLLFSLLSLGPVGLSVPPTLASEFAPGAKLRYIETAHFRVIYDQDELAHLAQRVSEVAEEVHDEMLAELQLPDPGRYDLVLLDNYDYSNGSATGFPTRVIRLIVTAPSPPMSGVSDLSTSVSETWLRELIVHEYAHALHLNYFTGWTRIFKWLFHANPFSAIYPGWFIEGFGVAAETSINQGGRGNTTATDMILRTAILDDMFLDVGAWGNVTDWPRGGSRYLYGGAFLYYVSQRFGPDSIKRIMDATNRELPWVDDLRPDLLADMALSLGLPDARLRQMRFGGLERGFQRATGVPLSALLVEWQQSLKVRYFQEAAELRAAELSHSTRLTRVGGSTRSPTLSPDGKLLAYVRSGSQGLKGIEILPLQAGPRATRVLVQDDVYGNLAWSPDGERLVYARMRDTNKPLDRLLTRADLFSLDLRSQLETRLTEGRRLFDPAFSPDGRYMVAIQNYGGQTRLVRLEPEGGEPLTLFEPDSTFQLATPMVSPDGALIVMSVMVQQEAPGRARYQLGLVDSEGRNFRLLDGPGVNREPDWIDAHRLLFSSDRSGIFNLYSLDVRTGEVRPLTNLLTGAFQPRIARPSEQGQPPRVIFRGYHSEGFDLYELEPNPLELLALMGAGPSRTVPRVGPDLELRIARTEDPPRTPEEAGVVPLTPLEPAQNARIYRDWRGLRLGTVLPLTGTDEGSWDEGYRGGMTLGLSANVLEPLDRHGFYAEVLGGLQSGAVSWFTLYRNTSLGLPIALYAQENSYLTETASTLPGERALVWDRGRGTGIGISLPFVEGPLVVAPSFDASLRQYQRFDAYVTRDGNVAGEHYALPSLDRLYHAGLRHTLSSQLSLTWSRSSVWRNPAQGHFLTLRYSRSQDEVSLDNRHPTTLPYSTLGHEIRGSYTGRVLFGRGNLDLDLVGGTRLGDTDAFLVGGNSGFFALPGVSTNPSDPALLVSGHSVGLAELTLSQDLLRPEIALGQVPLLFFTRLEGLATVGAAAAFSQEGRYSGSGAAFSWKLRAHLFSYHPVISVVPSIGGGIDLRDGTSSFWFNLEGIGLPLADAGLTMPRAVQRLAPWLP